MRDCFAIAQGHFDAVHAFLQVLKSDMCSRLCVDHVLAELVDFRLVLLRTSLHEGFELMLKTASDS